MIALRRSMGRQAANGCEAWDPASRARHNLWRLFVGKAWSGKVCDLEGEVKMV